MPRRRVSQAIREAWITQWVHLAPEAAWRLDDLAAEANKSRSELMRELIPAYLERLERNEVVAPVHYRGDMGAGRYQVILLLPRREAMRADRLAKELRVSKAALYREAVRQYLKEHGVEVEP